MSLAEAIGNYNVARKKAVEQFQLNFQREIAEQMKGIEGLEAIAFACYTPYFNDGEPCVFTVSDPIFQLSGDLAASNIFQSETYSYGLDGEWFELSWQYNKTSQNITSLLDTFRNIPEELFQNTFRNDVVIKITKNSLEVFDYSDHD